MAGPSAVPQWSRLQQSSQPALEHAELQDTAHADSSPGCMPFAAAAAAAAVAAAAQTCSGSTEMQQPSVLDRQASDCNRTAEHWGELRADQPAGYDLLPVSDVVITHSSMHELGYGQALTMQIQPLASKEAKQQQQLTGTHALASHTDLHRTSTACPGGGVAVSHPMDAGADIDSSSPLGRPAAHRSIGRLSNTSTSPTDMSSNDITTGNNFQFNTTSTTSSAGIAEAPSQAAVSTPLQEQQNKKRYVNSIVLSYILVLTHLGALPRC